MARILIDGYNLIGIAHRDFERARNELIQKLSDYAKTTGHSITVVFDGWKNGQATETKIKTGGITVIYSSLGEKADDVITNILSSSTKPFIIVSSDREIARFAERKNAVAIASDAFEKRLYAVLDAGDRYEEALENDEDFDAGQKRKKGNPRKLSRKDKRITEALKKL